MFVRWLNFEAVCLASALLIILASSGFAQHHDPTHQPSHQHGSPAAADQAGGWPGPLSSYSSGSSYSSTQSKRGFSSVRFGFCVIDL